MKHVPALLLVIPLSVQPVWACKFALPGPSSFEHLQPDAKVFHGTVKSISLGPCLAGTQYVEATVEFAVERAWQDKSSKTVRIKGPMLNEKCALPAEQQAAPCVDAPPFELIQAHKGQKAFLVANEQGPELRSKIFFSLSDDSASDNSRKIWDVLRKQRGDGSMPH